MKYILSLMVSAAAIALLPSCSQMQETGANTLAHAHVNLEQNNFRVVATQVSAEDTGFCLFPGIGLITKVIPIPGADNCPKGLTIVSPSIQKARKDLYHKTGADQPGRATQLINVREETGGLNAIIIGRPKVRVTADLIEFTR